MEEDLSSKMETLMTALDNVKRYRAIVDSLADFAMVIAVSIVITLSLNIIARLGIVFWFGMGSPVVNGFLSILILIVPFLGIAYGVFVVNRRVRSIKVGQWKNTLSEGAPGAIKLLQELKWENIFRDIRSAKLGFAVYGAAKILVFWLLATVIFSWIGNILGNFFHTNIAFIVVGLFSLVFVLFLSRNDLRKRYEKIGNLDSLLWELRWFDSEFRRADFKA